MTVAAKPGKLIKGASGDWEVVIGMEVHAQVTSKSKLFSGASTEFGGEPNSHVSLVDAAMPGMLPVINEECVKQAIRTGLGLKAKINRKSVFDRKNYFYPDLPQGYQISQYKSPIVGEGEVVVDLDDGEAKGYVVMKDRDGDTQYLLMPTAKITGIEDPAVLAPGTPNYFADAWQARHFTIDAAKAALPRNAISLAVNSTFGRSQNQLHIHIDCVRADVRDAVQRQLATIGDKWAPLAEPLAGHRYRAVRVLGDDLAANPFTLLADGIPGARDTMGKQTLVVLGATLSDGKPGFVILDDEVNLPVNDRASGEELQDHSCAIAHQ